MGIFSSASKTSRKGSPMEPDKMISETFLNALRAADKAATAAPWESFHYVGGFEGEPPELASVAIKDGDNLAWMDDGCVSSGQDDANADLIAMIRNVASEMAEVIEAAEVLLKHTIASDGLLDVSTRMKNALSALNSKHLANP